MDSVRDARDNATKQLQASANAVADYLDDGLASATHAAKQSVAVVRANTERALDEGQTHWGTAVAHFQHTQDQVFDRVRAGVHFAMENEGLTVSALTAAAVVLLPGPRRFLWRQTIGRFRSEESLYRSAERRYASVSESLDGAASEGTKLAQRLAAAEEQYDSGLRKLTATAKQISALQKQVRSAEKSSAKLVSELRELPSREALALRAQAAAKAAAAHSQAQGLERTLWRLAKKGVY